MFQLRTIPSFETLKTNTFLLFQPFNPFVKLKWHRSLDTKQFLIIWWSIKGVHFPIIALAVLILIWNKRSKFSTLYIEVDLKGNKWRTKNLITVFNWFVGFWIILLNIWKTMWVKFRKKALKIKGTPQNYSSPREDSYFSLFLNLQ